MIYVLGGENRFVVCESDNNNDDDGKDDDDNLVCHGSHRTDTQIRGGYDRYHRSL